MSKKINVDKLKLQNWQKEINDVISYFRQSLAKHHETVFFKSKNLIDTRWNLKEV